ncbi:MAG: hypothetical protein OXJ90_09070 [Spirochaetaceae bacterium]|nr:hypothetical protein [Spirochaetaceae bacterium]
MDLLVKNVPPELHERLRRHSRASRRTMSEVVLDAVERELARQEWQGRFAGRPSTKLGVPAAQMLELERAGREEQLG